MDELINRILQIIAVIIVLIITIGTSLLVVISWDQLNDALIKPALVKAEYLINGTPTNTSTATSTSTVTRTATMTLTATYTVINTPTFTATPTDTNTPTRTATSTFTETPTPSETAYPTETNEADIPIDAYISGYSGKPQKYTLDCEARVAVDIAAYFGIEIKENTFIENLPKSDNPNEGFVGNINGTKGRIPPESYGVYADPIADLLQDYGVNAYAKHGMTFKELKKEIAAGRPVMVWVINSVDQGYPLSYTIESGETITVAYWEHTVVVVGYDESLVYIIDPTYNTYYSRWIDVFKQSWSVLGNMAVVFQEP